jgi:hypothetical protein
MSDKATQPGTFMLTRSIILQKDPQSLFIQMLHTQARQLINQKNYEILLGSFLVIVFGDAFSRAVTMAVLPPLQNMGIAIMVFFKSATLCKAIPCLTFACWRKGR